MYSCIHYIEKEILKENSFPNSFLRYFIFPEKLQHALLNENTEDTCAHSLIVVWENNKTFLLIPYRTILLYFCLSRMIFHYILIALQTQYGILTFLIGGWQVPWNP